MRTKEPDMDYVAGPKLHHLDRALPERRVLKLMRGRGARVVCVAGDVWVTEDGRYDDVVLVAGESAVLERDGMAMITTFDSADVEIVPPAVAGTESFELPAIDAELVERYTRSARRMRAQAMATAFADAVEWLRVKLRPAPRTECCA
jgi:hypothetical protein